MTRADRTPARLRAAAPVRLAALAVFGALACACLDPSDRTQTLVWLDAQPAADSNITRVTVRAVGPDDEAVAPVEAKQPDWPLKLVFAPKFGDATRRFTVHVEVYGEGDVRLATVRLATGYVKDELRLATLMLHDRCGERPSGECSVEAGCRVWDLELPPAQLSRRDRPAQLLIAACEEADQADPTQPADRPREGETGPEIREPGADPDEPGDPGEPSDPADPGAPTATDGGPGPGAGAAGSTAGTNTVPVGPSGTCGPGLERSGDQCIDIDECADPDLCGELGECENLPSTFRCLCPEGYEDIGGSCGDVDECAEPDRGGCEGECVNVTGSVECLCPDSSWLKADRKTCGEFETIQTLGLVGSTAPTQPRFAFDGAGNGIAVWTTTDGTTSSLWHRRYRAGDGWAGFAQRFALAEGALPSYPRIALDAEGRGVVVFMNTVDSRSDLWASRYSGQGFATPTRIEHDDAGSAFDPSIAFDGNGAGFAVWTQFDGTRMQIWGNRLTAAGRWDGAEVLHASSTQDALGARIALDAQGRATLTWTQTVGDETSRSYAPWLRRFDPATSRWSRALSFDDSGSAGLPEPALFEPSGRDVIVWSRATSGSFTIYASSDDSSDPSVISDPDTVSVVPIFPRVSVAPSGIGAAIWSQGDGTSAGVWANDFDGAAWSEPLLLSAGAAGAATSPQIAVGGSGDGFGIWVELVGTRRTVRVRRLQAAVGWLPVATIGYDTTSDPPVNSPPQIVVDAQGNAVAIWDVLSDGQYYTVSRVFQ